MKKVLLFLALGLFFGLISCSGEESKTEPAEENLAEDEQEEVQDEQITKVDVLTLEGGLDGPEAYFFVHTSDLDVVPEMNELHIIPFEESLNDDGVDEGMIGIEEFDFELEGKLDSVTTTVRVFYDREKKKEAISYRVVNGNPSGWCTLRDLDDQVYISKKYEYDMCSSVDKSPYGVNWTYSEEISLLMVYDTANAYQDDSVRVINLMKHMRNPSGVGDLAKILDKSSFKRDFEVNGEVFTGQLNAFFNPKGFSFERPYFELNFKDGKLHGDVKIYNDWEELELHERFTEGQLDTVVYKINYDEMDGLAKPIIYLYPEEKTEISVNLKIDGALTHTYPLYNNGWTVTAMPDGTLTDEKGKSYYALYWEGRQRSDFNLTSGKVVAKDETVQFLEESLATLGLNRREANEFIIYWLPELQKNPYNLIHFSTDEYEKMAALNIQPEPETLIRVMMVFEPLDVWKKVPTQNLNKLAKERKGFTVVEWGGSRFSKTSDSIQ